MNINSVTISEESHIVSSDGSKKYRIKLQDGAMIESVFIPHASKNVRVCISSQVGCVNKCAYCATGQSNFVRDLTYNEILEQITFCLDNNLTSFLGIKLRVLFMGMGEPLLNFTNVYKACTELISADKYAIGWQDIILSTSGIVPEIRKLALNPFRPRLAISLNAPFSDLREKLMPVTKFYSFQSLIEACKFYAERCPNELIIEYVLISEVNDSDLHIYELSNLLSGLNCDIHVIPFNEILKSPFKKPSAEKTSDFLTKLGNIVPNVYYKPSYGIDVYGGCGQLEYNCAI